MMPRAGLASVSMPPPPKARLVTIRSLEVGRVAVALNDIAVADLSQRTTTLSSIVGRTVSGIIGQDVLLKHHAVIDVAGSTLYLMADGRVPTPTSTCR